MLIGISGYCFHLSEASMCSDFSILGDESSSFIQASLIPFRFGLRLNSTTMSLPHLVKGKQFHKNARIDIGSISSLVLTIE